MKRTPKGPLSRGKAVDRLRHTLRAQMDDDRVISDLEDTIPDAWALLEADVPCEGPKVKVTLYLDAPTATFFRAMGKGYQERINRLLMVYAQAKIAESRWFEAAARRELADSLRDLRDARERGE